MIKKNIPDSKSKKISKALVIMSNLFKKLLGKESTQLAKCLSFDMVLYKKFNKVETLRTIIPEDLEDDILEELNKHSIVIINNIYSVPLVYSYKINITSYHFKLKVNLTLEEDKAEKILKYKDTSKTKIGWYMLDWTKIDSTYSK